MKKFHRGFSLAVPNVLTHTDHTRRWVEMSQKLTREFILSSLEALQKNLSDARTYFKPEDTRYGLAKSCYEDVYLIVESLYNDENTRTSLTKKDTKIVSQAYAEYADFIRQTAPAKDYSLVRECVAKAIALDPTNRLAEMTSDDIKVNFHM